MIKIATQISVHVKCPPMVAFECAKKALFSFKNLQHQFADPTVMTVSAKLYHTIDETPITGLKAAIVTIKEFNHEKSELTITADFLSKNVCQMNVIFFIAEFLKRFSGFVNEIQPDS